MSFWRGKKVFLTGHTGFKGSWTSLLLYRLGAEVYGYSDEVPTNPALFDLAKIGADLTDTRDDINNQARVAAAMAEAKPDVVIHMAAQSLVKVGYSDPIKTFATNVMGTAHVLESAKHISSVRAIVIVTTDKCYENMEWPWGYRESDALGGHDPYSSSKACAELVSAAFRRSYFSDAENKIALATARAGNVIGGGDFAIDRIIPDGYRAFSKGVPLLVRNPRAIRPWQHVLDPIWGYLMLAEKIFNNPVNYSEGWNFGPGSGNEQSVDCLIEGMINRWGKSARWEQQPGQHTKETHALRIDASKAIQRLNWTPQLGFEMMLDWTTSWYQDYMKGNDVRAITLRQIDDYLSMVN